MDLIKQAKDFLEASSFSTQSIGNDYILGKRKSFAGIDEQYEIWVPNIILGVSFKSQENPYLRKFRISKKNNVSSHKICLVPSYEGISAEFREKASSIGVNVLVPIFFFDTEFRSRDETRSAATAALRLSQLGDEWRNRRVDQPFSIEKKDGAQKSKVKDLVRVISKEISKEQRSKISIIVGPAGMGKSVFFRVLFNELYTTFQMQKSRQQIFPRPLPLTDEYRPESEVDTLKGLIQGFLQTEFSSVLTYSSFVWMLTNGYASWLLDGLDEIIATDHEFFHSLEEIISKPNSQAQVILCVRDSLLTSNENLMEFIENYRDIITIYRLEKWDIEQKRAFASKSIQKDNIEAFLNILRSNEELLDLSSIPFYLSLILELHQSGGIPEPYDHTTLLNTCLDEIIKREFDKGLFDDKLISSSEIIEILEDISSEYAKNDLIGIPRELISDLTQIILKDGIYHNDGEKIVTQMVQLAVFSQGETAKRVYFTQEIFAQFLFGRYLLRLFDRDEKDFVREISGRKIPSDWVTNNILVEGILNSSLEKKMLDLLIRGELSGNAFRNVILVFVQLCEKEALPKDEVRSIIFNQQDLSGILFEEYDFRGMIFRATDLTDTGFIRCNLQNVKFEGALLNRTTFQIEESQLQGADFGDFSRLYSVKQSIKGSELNSDRARRWITSKNGRPDFGLPCPAAQQLRQLFGKFIDPLGRVKRVIIDELGITKGKQYIDVHIVIEQSVKYRFISHDVSRHRYIRCDGDLFSEMRDYVVDLKASPNIVTLLDELCDRNECVHISKMR